jgi:predicted dehydrogenase
MKNVGIVGLGKMGILHAGILNSMPDTRVTAICEKESLLVKLAKNLLPNTVTLYKNHAQMVENEELDAVFITTPISSHVAIATDLVAANPELSLFVEKPLGASADQALAACEAAKKLRGIHMVGFQKRYSPVFQRAKQLIEQDAIGDLMFFRAHSFSSDVVREGQSWRFRSGTGGVLLDLAPHVLDTILWFFGEPHSVLSVKRRLYSSEVDDYVHAAMSFESGLKGHMDTCWSIRSFRLPEISIEVHGKNGTLTVTDDFVKLEVEKGSGSVSRDAQIYYKQSFGTSVPFLLAEPEYTWEDQAFLLGIDERKLPESSFFAAAEVNTLIDRITESAEG